MIMIRMHMREILFRGKRTYSGEWVYGYYFKKTRDGNPASMKEPKTFIKYETWDEGFFTEEVDANTVGQFTGLTDKNGKKIFEGDILKIMRSNNGYNSYTRVEVVEYCEESASYDCFLFDGDIDSIEIIGNIWDNPELLRKIK